LDTNDCSCGVQLSNKFLFIEIGQGVVELNDFKRWILLGSNLDPCDARLCENVQKCQKSSFWVIIHLIKSYFVEINCFEEKKYSGVYPPLKLVGVRFQLTVSRDVRAMLDNKDGAREDTHLHMCPDNS
jgi:hypothetical protein